MFAHQVIDDLLTIASLRDGQEAEGELPPNAARGLIKSIRNCQHFHLGERTDIHDIMLKRHSCGKGSNCNCQPIFQLDNAKDVRLPFQDCWFDFTSGSRNIKKHVNEGYILSTKRAMLIREIDKHLLRINFFVFQNELKHWRMEALTAFVAIDGKVKEVFNDWEGHDIIVQHNQSKDDSNVLIALLSDKASLSESVVNDVIMSLYTLNMGLLLLGCKNIEAQKIQASIPLNKKRIKYNKQPIFTYHTLVLKPVGKKQESIPRHLWHNRIHLARGHFKTYTAEKPLFGHITGRFWWQPHIRGRNREGVVMKDYEVQTCLI